MNNIFKSVFDVIENPEFDNILVACHANPDGDAVGSSFALSYALRRMGKKCRVFCPDKIGADFSYITSEEKFLKDFPVKNVITVDTASPSMLGDNFEHIDKIALCIDHHLINTVISPAKLVLPKFSSCGEIIFSLLKEMKFPFDRYLSLCLYTAIIMDTGCFRYSNTTKNTFLAAAFLSDYAGDGDFYGIIKRLFETKSRKKLSLEAFAIQNVAIELNGKAAVLLISLEDMNRIGVNFQELDGLINVIRQIEGVEVSVVIKQKEADTFKISVRSENGFDASDFCSVFGGGGHFAAAGCTVKGTCESVRVAIISELSNRLNKKSGF